MTNSTDPPDYHVPKTYGTRQDPEEQRLRNRMAPGVLCRDGFLGHDHRPVNEIIASDRAEVDRLGLTSQQLADRLQEILEATDPAPGATRDVGENLEAKFTEGMGRIPSPFADGIFPKGEVELRRTDTGETLTFTPLSVHLIREHDFYQGHGSRYRIDPARLARVLGME